MRTNTPDMNITNQINAALNDVRKTLVDLSCTQGVEAVKYKSKARYQIELAMTMVQEHVTGTRSQPWSDRSPQVDEEFSE